MVKRRGLIPQSSSVAGDKQTVLKLPRRIDDAFAFYCGGLTGCSAMQNRAARKRDTACGKANSCTRLHTRIFFFDRALAVSLRGRAGNIMCVAGESVAWRTRGRHVEGRGTFRGTVVEGKDASKCWVLLR